MFKTCILTTNLHGLNGGKMTYFEIDGLDGKFSLQTMEFFYVDREPCNRIIIWSHTYNDLFIQDYLDQVNHTGLLRNRLVNQIKDIMCSELTTL